MTEEEYLFDEVTDNIINLMGTIITIMDYGHFIDSEEIKEEDKDDPVISFILSKEKKTPYNIAQALGGDEIAEVFKNITESELRSEFAKVVGTVLEREKDEYLSGLEDDIDGD